MGASPVLVGDKVFLACDQSTDSFLIAVSKVDGEIAWKVDRPQATSGHCTPIVYQPDSGAPQLILPGSFFLDAYDTETGERVWWVGGLCFEMKSVPALHDGVIYINGYGTPMNDPGNQIQIPSFEEVLAEDADGDRAISRSEMPRSRASGFFSFMDLDKDGTLDETEWSYLRAAMASQNGLLAIKAGGKGDMTDDSVLWAYRRTVPQLPSPLVYGGALYVLHDQGGLITTLDPKSGDVIERGRLSGAVDNYFASPVGADGKVYMVSQNGLVSVLEAGGSLESLALNDLDELCYATPAIADGRIYLRTGSSLYCFGIE
jgi:outer membrane protein assembly factor BamB